MNKPFQTGKRRPGRPTLSPEAHIDLLRYIVGFQEAHDGVSPSLGECRAALGLVSRSGVHRRLVILERLGFITRLRQRERAIRVLIKPPIPRAPDRQPLYAIPPFKIGQTKDKSP